jgi:hypothetical protein
MQVCRTVVGPGGLRRQMGRWIRVVHAVLKGAVRGGLVGNANLADPGG